jgi:hypothetical protein
MSDMMQRCMDMMSGCSMMESGMMDSNPMSWILPLALALLLVWALGLATLGALCVGVLELQNTLSWPSSFLGTATKAIDPCFKNVPFPEYVVRLSAPLQIGLYMRYSLLEVYQKRLSFRT